MYKKRYCRPPSFGLVFFYVYYICFSHWGAFPATWEAPRRDVGALNEWGGPGFLEEQLHGACGEAGDPAMVVVGAPKAAER